MSSGEPSKHLRHARSAARHRRISADTVKSDMRTKFIERLKKSRSKSVDRVRAALRDDREYASLDEIRKALLADKEAAELANSEEVTTVMRQLNEEMEQLNLQTEAGSSRTHNESESTAIAENLMNLCQICQTVSDYSVCESCTSILSSEFQE